ncbi:MAG: hypothetical protein ABIE68_01665 [bacterium]
MRKGFVEEMVEKHGFIPRGWVKALMLLFLYIIVPVVLFTIAEIKFTRGVNPWVVSFSMLVITLFIAFCFFYAFGWYDWLGEYWQKNTIGYYLAFRKSIIHDVEAVVIRFRSEVDQLLGVQILIPLGGWFKRRPHIYLGDRCLDKFWRILFFRELLTGSFTALLFYVNGKRSYDIGRKFMLTIIEMLDIITMFPAAELSISSAEPGYKFATDILSNIANTSRLGKSKEGRYLRREFALRFRDILPPGDKCWEEFDY